jgi:hypothetical protein
MAVSFRWNLVWVAIGANGAGRRNPALAAAAV